MHSCWAPSLIRRAAVPGGGQGKGGGGGGGGSHNVWEHPLSLCRRANPLSVRDCTWAVRAVTSEMWFAHAFVRRVGVAAQGVGDTLVDVLCTFIDIYNKWAAVWSVVGVIAGLRALGFARCALSRTVLFGGSPQSQHWTTACLFRKEYHPRRLPKQNVTIRAMTQIAWRS